MFRFRTLNAQTANATEVPTGKENMEGEHTFMHIYIVARDACFIFY
jgi:hypothetical protein